MRRSVLAPLAAAALLAAHAPSVAAQGHPVEGRATAAADASIRVRLTGDVQVTGWDRNEVYVGGTVARRDDQVLIEGSGRSISVRLRGARGPGSSGRLEVRVPAGASVEVANTAGRVAVAGVGGAVEVTSYAGPISVAGAPRSVKVSSAGGPVTLDVRTATVEVAALGGPVRVSGAVSRRVEVSSLGGNVDLLATSGDVSVDALGGTVRVTAATGRVNVTAVSGNVEVTGTGLRGSIESVSGNVLVTATRGLGEMTLETHSGNVELRLPRGSGAVVDLSTWSGRFQAEVAHEMRSESRRERQIVVGRGGPAIRISTFSGSVKLAHP